MSEHPSFTLSFTFEPPKLPASTPRVTRSDAIAPGKAILIAGDSFEDGLRRLVVATSVSDAHVDELTRRLLSLDTPRPFDPPVEPNPLKRLAEHMTTAWTAIAEQDARAIAQLSEILGEPVELTPDRAIELTQEQLDRLKASMPRYPAPSTENRFAGIPIRLRPEVEPDVAPAPDQADRDPLRSSATISDHHTD